MAMATSDWFLIALCGRTLDTTGAMDLLSEQARQLVDEFWQPIVAIAAALVTRGRVSRAEAAWVVSGHHARVGVGPLDGDERHEL